MAVSGRKTLEHLLSHIQSDEGDSNLSDHLAELLHSVMSETPSNAYCNMEKMSSFLKKHKGYRPTVSVDPILPGPITQRGRDAADTLQRSKIPPPSNKVTNFLDDAAMLRWAGISFGDAQNYDISLRIKELGKSLGNDLVDLRLWGKLLGVNSDYWIAEGQVSANNVALGPNIEVRGKGANTYSYWALSTLPGSTWETLPNLRPEWVTSSKFIRKHLTGNLDSEVNGFVPFPAKERAYLRTLIARISAACVLAPNGAFAADEEQGIQPNPEFEFPATDDLKEQAAWVHAREHILLNGRTSYPEVDEADEELARQVEAAREADPPIEKLRGIASDEPVNEGESAGWTVMQKGDVAQYAFDGSHKSYAVSVVRSNRWPGAFAVAQGTKYCNIYVGYGLRDVGDPFYPLAPGEVQAEPQDEGEEADEPNPAEEVVSDQESEDEQQEGEK